ncbi:hypothetical protein HETIRDRAFT_326652 [Heterobasidion irregulare TC 32-1]|uniref:Uncharacterized protein n=1 Tax=Heterobasidion irregulare (strain TC 32-1) TaxID=747525 RepID=W4JU43_HETIT|nr:uncharacterized protein HETIRDRAFT_326652 [Heterobasidion irregulare TC 32-1]ETW76979.1 hypothetical protein HETIRDRAFT_326652 [Heterobasidion irregulare TC 32-1]
MSATSYSSSPRVLFRGLPCTLTLRHPPCLTPPGDALRSGYCECGLWMRRLAEPHAEDTMGARCRRPARREHVSVQAILIFLPQTLLQRIHRHSPVARRLSV